MPLYPNADYCGSNNSKNKGIYIDVSLDFLQSFLISVLSIVAMVYFFVSLDDFVALLAYDSKDSAQCKEKISSVNRGCPHGDEVPIRPVAFGSHAKVVYLWNTASSILPP
ncbi:hypothetical protein H6P81_014576 [Aristolochia fimbriata]|uniref:Uncharacterized protein n=1 Tax=Aristolochia fimbriata TaxID=158543 RepID=A0AAV7E5Z7_ARIFI|nr:hypothetical protein H6P81_014576 [Aristolochia fimbriata]